MPKKRSHNFKDIQGRAASTTASSSSKDGTGRGAIDAASVNERLTELRKIESPDAAHRKRLLAETVNQRSVPPSLGDILGVPESAPPKPKLGVRLRERMRTPGPPPPGSWLGYESPNAPTLTIRGGGGRGFRRPKQSYTDRKRPRTLLRFAKLLGTDEVRLDRKPHTLLHLTLKSAAQAWDLLDEADYPALAELPLTLRLKLLSYVGFYGPPLDMSALRALLQGAETITHLDLAGLLGYGEVNLKNLIKLLQDDQSGGRTETLVNDVVDSWEDDDVMPVPGGLDLSPSLSHLTYLSLSHPPSSVLWQDFLSMSKHVPHLTHLSLAYWPRPTLTPNLSTAIVSSKHSPDISAGGSNAYSTIDGDVTEPANILRRLSSNLLRLQWLDLEGCSEWIPALIRCGEMQKPRQAHRDGSHDPTWSLLSQTSSVLTTHWKNVTYINMAQGWFPSKQGVILTSRNSARRHVAFDEDIIQHLEELEVESEASNDSQQKEYLKTCGVVMDADEDAMIRRTHIWKSEQYRLFRFGAQIISQRKRMGAQPISIDYGWNAKRLWRYGTNEG